eukprot:5696999-Amphidinium_carterae.1
MNAQKSRKGCRASCPSCKLSNFLANCDICAGLNMPALASVLCFSTFSPIPKGWKWNSTSAICTHTCLAESIPSVMRHTYDVLSCRHEFPLRCTKATMSMTKTSTQ